VFDRSALPLVNHVLDGFNGTFFVYGQTGTGKSHTMGVLSEINDESSGIIVNSLGHIFDSLVTKQKRRVITEWQVQVSFFEIYTEQIKDLLNSEAKPLKLREEQGEVYVEGLV
jgi:ABC-type oligopeptide transport system ATPase subunit